MIQSRKIRGGVALNKRWAFVFARLVNEVIHIEQLKSMDASSIICALRRFFPEPASRVRCDRGENFVGAKTESKTKP